jgi:hypothetical protein
MPRVFISYARHDLNHIQQLERALQAHDVSVWRDQESIYGGQQWPKAIGPIAFYGIRMEQHHCLTKNHPGGPDGTAG